MADSAPRQADVDAARAALTRYGMPDGSRLRPIRTTNNTVFAVVAGPDGASLQYALRVHRRGYRTAGEIRSELELLQLLRARIPEREVSLPHPVPSTDGELMVEVGTADAARYCDLLTWVDGSVRRPGRGFGPQAAYRLGRALGWIHGASRGLPPGFDRPIWDADAMFGPDTDEPAEPLTGLISSTDWLLYCDVADRTRAVFEQLADADGAWGVVHFDFILLNCHLRSTRSGWQVGVIDFDDCGWGYLPYDLAPLLGNLSEFPGYAARRRAVLAGYRSVRPLPAAWEPHLRLLMAARHVQTARWAAQLERTARTGPPAAEHIAMRMDLVRELLP